MSLINCPECGKEISSYAKECLNCGFPINSDGFSIECGAVTEYSGNASYVAIPYGIKTVSQCALKDHNEIIIINIPNTVSSIESYAIWNCMSLLYIRIPNSVHEMGEEAIRNCPNAIVITNSEYVAEYCKEHRIRCEYHEE